MNGLRLVYYINSRIPCVCVCVCVSVCVFVISEISGTGCCSATLLTPSWRASNGKLQRLVFKSTRRVVWEKKPLELFYR